MPRNVEIERRWLVTDHDGSIRGYPRRSIEQGYLDVPGQLRVRISTTSSTGCTKGELTRKEGKGIERSETTAPVSVEAAQMLLDTTPFRIRKTRYDRDGWECDFFHDALEGLVLLERELSCRDEDVVLPSWVGSATEVTRTLSNKQLAMTSHLIQGGTLDPSWVSAEDVPCVVLTGGPCAGKSSIIRMLQDDRRVHCVPEVASIIMGQVGVTPDVIEEGLFQRTMYRVQRAFEVAANRQAKKLGRSIVVLDRGTLDSAAFMSTGLSGFERACGTTRDAENSAYDAIVLLGVLGEDDYGVHRTSNPVRRETWEQSVAIQSRLLDIWGTHPNLVIVPSSSTLEQKYEAVRRVIGSVIMAV